jgi:hypothetical protein
MEHDGEAAPHELCGSYCASWRRSESLPPAALGPDLTAAVDLAKAEKAVSTRKAYGTGALQESAIPIAWQRAGLGVADKRVHQPRRHKHCHMTARIVQLMNPTPRADLGRGHCAKIANARTLATIAHHTSEMPNSQPSRVIIM